MSLYKWQILKNLEKGRYDIIFGLEDIQSELVISFKIFEEKLLLISKSEVNRKKLQDYR